MKSIDVLRRERLRKENDRIAHLLSLYNDSGIDAVTKSELKKRLKFSKNNTKKLKKLPKLHVV